MKRKIIDISSEEKKKEVYNLFVGFKNKNEAHEYFGISDNKSGLLYIKTIANAVGFDINSYKKKKYCLNCGKEIVNKWGSKFCSSSCSATFNNKKRSHDIYERISKKLKEKFPKKEKIITKRSKTNKKTCIFCGKEFVGYNNYKYCSHECASKHQHEIAYKSFLENNEQFCRGNYTPKAFRNDFIKEQGGVCAICGCKPEHNGKPLVFVIDHIDGNAANNKRDNLRCICPNCDSQLDTFKSKNKNSTRRNYWMEKLIKEIKKDK